MTGTDQKAGHDGAAIDIAAGLVLAATALFAILWLVPENTESASSEFDIAPAFFPTLSAGIVLVLAIGMVVHRIVARPARDAALSGMGILAETIVSLGIAALAVAGLVHLGFLPVATLLIGAGMVAAGQRNWLLIIAISLVFPVLIDQGAWLIFTVDLP